MRRRVSIGRSALALALVLSACGLARADGPASASAAGVCLSVPSSPLTSTGRLSAASLLDAASRVADENERAELARSGRIERNPFIGYDFGPSRAAGEPVYSGTVRLWRIGQPNTPGASTYLIEIGGDADHLPTVQAEAGRLSDFGFSGDARLLNVVDGNFVAELDPGNVQLVASHDIRVMRLRLPQHMQLVGYSEVSIYALETQSYYVASMRPGTGFALETDDQAAVANRQRHAPVFRLSITASPEVADENGHRVDLSGMVSTAVTIRTN